VLPRALREQRKKQLDWLVKISDDITSQSHSPFELVLPRALREQRKKQLDWLAKISDDITSQSHSIFLFRAKKSPSREVISHVIYTHISKFKHLFASGLDKFTCESHLLFCRLWSLGVFPPSYF
jgi:hypothetical protein